MEDTPFKTEEKKLSNIDQKKDNKWSFAKTAVIVAIFIVPFGPLALAVYFGTREIIKRKGKQK